MLNIIFTPASGDEDVVLAANVYSKIWKNDGSRITKVAEKISGLKFKEKKIIAKVHRGMSRSEPLYLDSRFKSYGKRGNLIHELLHRLLYANGVDKNEVGENKLESHKILDLILYDIWVEIYGAEFADWVVNQEKSFSDTYKKAWEWALNMNEEERKSKFTEIVTESGSSGAKKIDL